MRNSITPSAILILAMITAAAPVQVLASEPPILQLLEEMTESIEHHQSIASYYRRMAEHARADVEKHQAMMSNYRQGVGKMSRPGARQSMYRHCERLIQIHQSAVDEYEALAALHEAEAEAD